MTLQLPRRWEPYVLPYEGRGQYSFRETLRLVLYV
jgi:hypothetical protein